MEAELVSRAMAAATSRAVALDLEPRVYEDEGFAVTLPTGITE